MCPVDTATAPLRGEQYVAKCILFLCTAIELWCIKINKRYFYISIKLKEKKVRCVWVIKVCACVWWWWGAVMGGCQVEDIMWRHSTNLAFGPPLEEFSSDWTPVNFNSVPLI